MKKLILIAIAVLCLGIGNAHAVIPTIDGLLTSADEWDGYVVYGTDINEGTIADSWDIKAVYMKIIAGDGWYFRMDTFDTPLWTGAPGQSAGDEAFWQFRLDLDGNLTEDWVVDFNDKSDPNSRIVGLYNSVGTKTADDGDGTDGDLDDIIEMYIPHLELSTSLFSFSDFGLYAVSDGKGSDPDDRLPNSGWQPTVPEPASMSLLGLGLLGLVGVIRRKKVTA